MPLTIALRNLISWQPSDTWVEGYTVVIACMNDLDAVAVANLRSCALLHHDRLHQIILVFDCLRDDISENVRSAAHEISREIPVELIGYSERQFRVAKGINWGWVYSWLSWCLGIAHSRTRAVILHDLDAMPLAPSLFENLYDNWLEMKADFCGIRRYKGNGVPEELGLVATFEMVLDAGFVRRNCRPFDLFNKLELASGRVVDFDTTLYVQLPPATRAVRSIDETDLLHPSRLICQYTDLVSGRSDFTGQDHGLFMLIYFLFLGGHSEPLHSAALRLTEEGCRKIPLFGKEFSIDGITPMSWAWTEKQIRRAEQFYFGKTRPEVERYLTGIITRAGAHRTVGVETGPFAVAAY